MDNFSQEDKEKKITEQTSQDQEIKDIQFEDVINVEEIQEKLNYEVEDSLEEEQVNEKPEKKSLQKLLNQPAFSGGADKNIKKYVIYVDPYNIDYMESLSAKERKEIINKILKEQHDLSVETKNREEKKRFLTHAVLACLTFIICFPLLFFIVNKATEITISNYKQAKINISKLYKEKGKIKIKKSESVKNIEY